MTRSLLRNSPDTPNRRASTVDAGIERERGVAQGAERDRDGYVAVAVVDDLVAGQDRQRVEAHLVVELHQCPWLSRVKPVGVGDRLESGGVDGRDPVTGIRCCDAEEELASGRRCGGPSRWARAPLPDEHRPRGRRWDHRSPPSRLPVS